MAAVIGGLTLLELAQLFSALAGGSFAAAQLVELIRKHLADHPEALEQLKSTQPDLAAKLQNHIFTDPNFPVYGGN